MGDADPNPYLLRPEPPEPTPASLGVLELETAECWKLMEQGSLGRFVVSTTDDAPDVFPMNYLVHEGSVYVRSAPGGKLRAIVAHPLVAFEVDGEDHRFRWSVVIRGTARRLESDDEIESSGILQLVSWSPTPKHDFVQLTPSTITGRRFPKARAADRQTREHADEHRRLTNDRHDSVPDKPHPIPHFPPLPDR